MIHPVDRGEALIPREAEWEGFSLEPYRGYLLALARVQLARRPMRTMGASDAVQETFLKAHRRKHQFRGNTEGEWRAWLRRILANVLADGVDRVDEKRIKQSLDRTSIRLQGFAAVHSTPSQKAQKNEMLMRLANALAQLSADERLAVELRYLHDPRSSLKDIAQQLNRPTAKAAANVLARGLKKLRHMLGNPDHEKDDA